MNFSYEISVIMATYNTEISMLKEAINSILNQTFTNFEFIIVDDGSDNGTHSYLESIDDCRVKIITNSNNIGITKSLNIGLKLSQGKYIARMDADDISAPTRLENEYNYMEKHTHVIVCGSRTAEMIGDTLVPGPKIEQRSINMEEYRVKLLFKNPGPIHPSVMIRHEPLLIHNISYDERLIYAQDYGLWETLSHYGKFYVLKEMLLYRRKHENQISVARREIQISCDKMTQKKILLALLGNVTEEEVNFHYIHSSGYYPDAVISPEVAAWYDRLVNANKERRIYNQRYLKQYVAYAKKRLIVRSFNQNMSFCSKISLFFHYIPLYYGFKMIVGYVIRLLISLVRKKKKSV